MDAAIPAGIVAPMEQLGQLLRAAASRNVDAPLASLEEEVLDAVHAILPKLLGAMVQLTQRSVWSAHRTEPRPCPTCGKLRRVHSQRPRLVVTVCGRLRFERSWYVCRPCKRGFSPTDTVLQVAPGRRLSVRVEEWLTELGVTTSFAEAASLASRLLRVPVSAETVRQTTEAAGAALEAEEERAAAFVAHHREAAGPLDVAPGQLVVETDGVMVRYRDGWHEMKLMLAGGMVDGELQAKSYRAGRMSPEQFGPRLLAEAARRGALEVVGWQGSPLQPRLAMLREVVVLGDGAHWIWNVAAEHFGDRVEVVDWYHATAHLWTAGKALFGEGAVATAWVEARTTELWEQGVLPVQQALEQVHPPDPAVRLVLQRERGYFRTNAHRMDYPAFRKAGIPIGSGAIESAGRQVIQQRLKRAGCHWSQPGAQYVANVRCLWVSNHQAAA